jgi:hypothetical protein
MASGRRALVLCLAGCALGALAAAAAPDRHSGWLITRQGDRIATAGAWRQQGKMVVFSRPDGSLASLRLSEVDLEASQAATREAATGGARENPAPQSRPPVVRLTDGDFRHAAPAEAQAPAPKTGSPAARPASRLMVASWTRTKSPDDGHLVIRGTVRNSSADQAISAEVTAHLLDAHGVSVGSVEALLTSTVVPAGGTIGFVADFPGVFTFTATKFETRSLNLPSRQGEPPGARPDRKAGPGR